MRSCWDRGRPRQRAIGWHRESSSKLFELLRVETAELRQFSCRVFLVDFDQAVDEEIFLLCRARLPVIRLLDCDYEANISSTFFGLLILLTAGDSNIVRLNGGQVVENPGLANREGAVVVFSSLMHPYTTRLPHSNDNNARLLIRLR